MERGSNAYVAIIVAVITVAGGIATAVITNWDNFRDEAGSDRTSDARESKERQAATSDDAKAEPSPPVKSSAASDPGRIPRIEGNWTNIVNGQQLVVRQAGAEYEYGVFAMGAQVGGGRGRITGDRTHSDSWLGNVRGECDGRVAPDEGSISGYCEDVYGNREGFQLHR